MDAAEDLRLSVSNIRLLEQHNNALGLVKREMPSPFAPISFSSDSPSMPHKRPDSRNTVSSSSSSLWSFRRILNNAPVDERSEAGLSIAGTEQLTGWPATRDSTVFSKKAVLLYHSTNRGLVKRVYRMLKSMNMPVCVHGKGSEVYAPDAFPTDELAVVSIFTPVWGLKVI
jgi:hypothetical protein